MTETQRSYAIDHAKCIGIILVIFGHFPNNIINVLMPYTFHMPLFFFIGGMLFSIKKGFVKFYKGILTKYLLYIVISYLILGMSAKVLHHYFNTMDMNVFGSNPIETIKIAITNNFHNNMMFIIGWFLFSYMILLAISFPLFKTAMTLQRWVNTDIAFIIIGLAAGYVAIVYIAPEYKTQKLFQLNVFSQVLVGLMFFSIGYALKDVIWKILNPYVALIIFLSVYVLRQYGLITTTYVSWSTYNDGFYMTLISALSGIYITLFFAYLLSLAGEFNLSRFIGINSKSIMTFHMLTFTVIDIIVSKFGLFTINQHNIMAHYIKPFSFPIYLIASIILSFLIGKALSVVTFRKYS